MPRWRTFSTTAPTIIVPAAVARLARGPRDVTGYLDTCESESYLPLQVTPLVSFDDHLSCEGYFSPWPEGVSVDLLGRQGLPYEALPDGRLVFFIPNEERFGSFTTSTWGRLLQSAKDARRAVTLHAYDVTLGALQLWREIGPLMSDAWERCKHVEADRHEFHRILDEVDPSGRNRKIEQWIRYWAKHLCEKPSVRFTPSEEALGVLGYPLHRPRLSERLA
jgi:hypothetical protein